MNKYQLCPKCNSWLQTVEEELKTIKEELQSIEAKTSNVEFILDEINKKTEEKVAAETVNKDVMDEKEEKRWLEKEQIQSNQNTKNRCEPIDLGKPEEGRWGFVWGVCSRCGFNKWVKQRSNNQFLCGSCENRRIGEQGET